MPAPKGNDNMPSSDDPRPTQDPDGTLADWVIDETIAINTNPQLDASTRRMLKGIAMHSTKANAWQSSTSNASRSERTPHDGRGG